MSARKRRQRDADSVDVGSSFELRRIRALELLLDPENPRLGPIHRAKPQAHLVEVMINQFEIAEIAESICTAGFLPLDPFIGYDGKDGKTYILEGNRRLATIQLLLEPSRAPPAAQEEWRAFARRVAVASREQMTQLEVRVFPTRDDADVLAYVGYRHVSGVMPWRPAEKAVFIAHLIEQKGVRWSYQEIGRKIGSTGPAVAKLYVAHQLIEQCAEYEVAGATEMREKFGVLQRALQSPEICAFLELVSSTEPRSTRHPARCSQRDLGDFVRWTFGADDAPPLLEDSRQITNWGRILASPDALQYLRSSSAPSFERALIKSGGLRDGIVDELSRAAASLEEVVPNVRQHRNDDQVCREVGRCADYLAQILQHFPDVVSKYFREPRT